MELHVSKRLKDLLPPLSDEEREQLEANILADEVVRDPIIYWAHDGKNIIVDGMNRYAIATKHKIPYKTAPSQKFESIEHVELWMLENALGRRNLMKPHELRKVRGELYNRLKREDLGHGDQKSARQNVGPIHAAEVVADKTGVTPRTIERDGAYVEALGELPSALRKALDSTPATDAEVKQLAKLDGDKQQQVARNLRTGAASVKDAMKKAGVKPASQRRDAGANGAVVGRGDTENRTESAASLCSVTKGLHSWVSDGNGDRYCEQCKEDHPDNPKPHKPAKGKEKVSAAKLVDEAMRHFAGASGLVQLIDRIATANGGKGHVHKAADKAVNELIGALKSMREGKR